MTPPLRVGFAGLGAIGTPMVRRLAEAGHMVTVHPRGQGMASLAGLGLPQCDDYGALAAASDALVLCVYSDAQVAEILFDAGALARLRPGALLIIHTTGSPAFVRRIAAEAPAGVEVLDACFSGGPDEVAAGTLTLMVGGTSAGLERARPLLSCYAGTIHPAGGHGHGQLVKLLNNLLFAANLMNAAELLRLAGEQGLDLGMIAGVIGASSGQSFAMDLFRRPAPPQDILQAIRPYLQKDVAAALAAARDTGLDSRAFALVADYFALVPAE